jgi:site-specific DNA-methyltransferase (adenine-specific)
MPEIDDCSVALVVTSPPYFAGKEYEEALGQGGIPSTYVEYLKLLRDVFGTCVETLEPGGRIAVNVANLGRKPYRSLAADIVRVLQDDLRLLLRGEVIWQKARGSSGSCAWGSFQRPGNPVLRDLTERVVIASKGRFDRAVSPEARANRVPPLPSSRSLSADEFMEATLDVWEIPPESAVRVNHPAPFPVDLPARLIHLYTYYDDLVLDPFMGSGTTAVAAVRTGRHFVGYDTDGDYVARAKDRVEHERARLRREPASNAVAFRLPATPVPADPDEDFQSRATREGKAAKEVAAALLRDCGFDPIEREVKVGAGVSVNFRA